MPKTLHRSFAGGEITPEAYGRVDLDRYQTALAQCKNFITLPHGPLQRRPGFAYVLEAKYKTKKAVLIPFIYSTEQAYVLEFGDQYLRIHTEGLTLLNTAKNIEDISIATDTITITAHGYTNGTWVYITGVEGTTELNGRFFKVDSASANSFKLLDLADTAVDMAAFGEWIAGGTVASVYEVATPYAHTDLAALHYTQSADVLTLVHPEYQQRQLSRQGPTNWTLSTLSFSPTQGAPTGVTATPTGSGSVSYSYVVTALSNDDLEESFASSAASCLNNLATSGNFNKITWTNVTGAVRYNVYRGLNGLYGYIGQSSNGTTGFKDDNIAPDVSLTPPEPSDPFTSTDNYPGAVGYFEGRRWFGGTINNPQGLWGTRSGTESNMARSIPVRDDDAISVYLRSHRASTIRHIVPLTDLLLLTSDGEWRISAQNSEAITPSSISYRPVGGIGANNTTPVVTSSSLLYTQASGGRVRELAYALEEDMRTGYRTTDISILAPHLFDGYDIVSMAYTKAPNSIVWCARSDGLLLGLTYVPEHKVLGWHQHPTDGEVESVAAIPEDGEDRLYAVIKRRIGFGTVRYVERLAPRFNGVLEDAFYVDSGASYIGPPATKISGLHHLENEIVDILADGAVVTPQVVQDGAITLPVAAEKVHIGLHINALAETLPAVWQSETAGLGDTKSISAVTLRVHNASGILVGASMDNLVEYRQRTTEPYGVPPALFSGVLNVVVSGEWEFNGSLFMAPAGPVPLTVLSMAADIVGD